MAGSIASRAQVILVDCEGILRWRSGVGGHGGEGWNEKGPESRMNQV
jgi:hypothetical protein